ncbi:MAG: L-threonine 3-dehydrogenase [Planctomycetes bacterium]|nr:L-threonine 3-dehydrogenase [Planctomycetota bacterium]
MKALVKSKREVGVWLDDVPVPTIGINDVLIKVLRTGICGTDLHIYKWDAWAQKTIPVPLVIGHEFVGVIVEVGSNVTDFHVGEIVSGEGHVVCGRCRNCLAGRRHLCKATQGVGVNRPGAFAEYIALPFSNVWVHGSSDEWRVASAEQKAQAPATPTTHCSPMATARDVQSIFDPYGNAVHTALSFDILGEDVLITGAGPIGCMAAAIVQHAGARHVVITDMNPYRLALAKKLGATRAVDVRTEKLKDVQAELGMREGFDVGLEMSGNGDAFRDMLANMAHGGKIAILGIPDREIAIDWNLVIFNMLTLKGIYGREMYETWYYMTVMLQTGLDISPVVTHRYPWNEYQKGFDAMLGGNCGKVVLTWAEG